MIIIHHNGVRNRHEKAASERNTRDSPVHADTSHFIFFQKKCARIKHGSNGCQGSAHVRLGGMRVKTRVIWHESPIIDVTTDGGVWVSDVKGGGSGGGKEPIIRRNLHGVRAEVGPMGDQWGDVMSPRGKAKR